MEGVMGRVIGSVVLGYVVMAGGVFLLFALAWLALGPDGAFAPGAWSVTPAWIGMSIVVGFVAATAGGWVCAAVARDPRGPKALLVVVVLLGLLFALPVLLGAGPDTTGARPPDVTMTEAMSNAQQPPWVALLNPLLGAVGVWLGARFRRPAAA
jgi:hypothetical protein